jgi:hypothetical protein
MRDVIYHRAAHGPRRRILLEAIASAVVAIAFTLAAVAVVLFGWAGTR